MQSVNDKWYKFYFYIATAVAFLVLVASLVTVFVPSYAQLGHKLGLNVITLALASFQLIYAVFFHKIAIANSYWLAMVTYSMLQATTVIAITHGSGRLESWTWAYWMFITFMSGSFGIYATIGLYFMIAIYYASVVTELLNQKLPIDPVSSAIVMGGTLLAAIISYLTWHRQYKKHENQKLAQLSGMLANKDQQAEILIESIADGIVLINTEGKISLINSVAAEMSEWTVDEALGIDVQLVIKVKQEDGTELPPAEHPFAKVLINKEKLEETLKLVGRNNREITMSLVISPVIIPGKKEIVGVVAVMRDISAAREEENRRADFVSTASHEMRTPVAAIEGYLQLSLNDKVAQIDSKARGYLEKALDSTHHLGKLFQDLLTSAKAEDGRLVSHPVAVEMGEFLDSLSDSLRFSAEKKGLLMEYTVGVSNQDQAGSVGGGRVIKPLYYVNVDPDRLREVITNIFDNAVKYTDTGKISIGLTGNDGVVQMYVKDTGPGIPEVDLPHLFQKFYRVDSSATRTIGGTGLGLFICRKIVEMYKGRIWVESTVGQGSTFYINLPRVSTARAASMQSTETTQPGL